jgi:threonine aldolase
MSTTIRIDLQSDTQTRPTEAMRHAMVAAPVGDEQRNEDPSVNALCQRVMELLGKEAAIFLPSGTMCNMIAILVHCRAGDEIIAADVAHIISTEAAGAAALAGAQIRPLLSEAGIFTAQQVQETLRPIKRNVPPTRLVCVEQTVNRSGGKIWPLDSLQSIAATARENGLSMHMDGARLLNAVVATGIPAKDYAKTMDSLWIDLSKGLGCPVGGVLAGSHDFIEQAWPWKHRLGGAMRQAGILAAAGSFALDHHVERLAEDHQNAQVFAEQISNIPGLRLENPNVETNLIFINVENTGLNASDISARMLNKGVRIGITNENCLRAVTHLDVGEDDVREAAGILAEVLA